MNAPSVAQIRAFVAENGLTGGRAAELAYLSGGQAFRKYTGGAKPHRMSGAIWFTLVAKTMLPESTIAEIERRMQDR